MRVHQGTEGGLDQLRGDPKISSIYKLGQPTSTPDPEYFEIACKRVEEAYRQPDLFVEPPKKPEQEAMDL